MQTEALCLLLHAMLVLMRALVLTFCMHSRIFLSATLLAQKSQTPHSQAVTAIFSNIAQKISCNFTDNLRDHQGQIRVSPPRRKSVWKLNNNFTGIQLLITFIAKLNL